MNSLCDPKLPCMALVVYTLPLPSHIPGFCYKDTLLLFDSHAHDEDGALFAEVLMNLARQYMQCKWSIAQIGRVHILGNMHTSLDTYE